MAEILGTCASGIGIASFSLQLGKSVQQLVEFCKDVQNAPQEVVSLLADIEFLVGIVVEIDKECVRSAKERHNNSHIIDSCAQLCHTSALKLNEVAQEMERGIESAETKRIWGSIKFVLKKKKIAKWWQKLESTKSNLMLATQLYNQCSRSKSTSSMALEIEDISSWELINGEEDADTFNLMLPDRVLQSQHWNDTAQQILSSAQNQSSKSSVSIAEATHVHAISTSVKITNCSHTNIDGAAKGVEPEKHLPGLSATAAKESQAPRIILSKASTTSYLLGLVKYQTKAILAKRTTTTAANDSEVVEKLVTFDLPTWLWSKHYAVHMRRATGGWDWKLRTYNVVSPLSPIFVHCANGDVESVQNLFASGQASPFDIDPEGSTLVHHAAAFAQIDTCRLLVESGLNGDTQPSNTNISAPVNPSKSALFSGSPLHSLAWFSRDLSPLARQSTYHQIFHHRPNHIPSQVTMDDISTLMQFLMNRGRYDPMATDHNGGTVISTYVGPPDIFLDTFVADASQEDDPGAAAVVQIASKRYINVTNIILAMLPAGRIDENMARYKDNTGYTLLHGLCWRARHYWLPLYPYRRQDKHPLHPCHAANETGNSAWRDMLIETVTCGADLHAECMLWRDLRTPLDYFLAGFSRTETFTRPVARYIRAFIREWLRLLDSTGIDIAFYGQQELECRKRESRSAGHEWARMPGWDVVDMVFGTAPEDFNVKWSGDYEFHNKEDLENEIHWDPEPMSA